MSFAKFSSECLMDGSTSLENLYISEFMPSMPDVINKVYIYGLFLCTQADAVDNSLQGLAARLGIDTASVVDSYEYLAGLGLVQVLQKNPIEVRYLPIRLGGPVRKFKPEKYADFNTRMQELLAGRMITPNEFHEYYSYIEDFHLEPEALLLIAGYAVSLKDNKVGYSYILTIAKNWAKEGITTVAQVEERLLEYDAVSKDLTEVCKALGTKRTTGYEDRKLYLKWTKGMEFDKETVLAVAKTCKKGGFEKLDARLTRYYEAKLFTLADINAYEQNKDSLIALARSVNRALGLYYESVDSIIDTYVTVWLNLGFDEDAILAIADICFKRGIRTLEGLDGQIQKFYREGLLSSSAISGHVARLSDADDRIAEVLSAAGQATSVNTRARDLYRTWTYAWEFSHEVVLYAATLARTATQPMPYINKILADWKSKGLKALDECKAASTPTAQAPEQKPLQTHTYTAEQLNALIDNINEVEF